MSVTMDHFRHEALLYSGQRGFVAGCVPFIQGGLGAGEPVLVVESAETIAMLRTALGSDADRVMFANMSDVGANPARIIPAWKDFVDRHGSAGRRLRGIGEPIWNGRSPDELVECQRHESLLNVAFGGGQAWWLLCPYDVDGLDPSVIDEARRSHEYVTVAGESGQPSRDFRGIDASGAPFGSAFPEPGPPGRLLEFDRDGLLSVRGEVARQALDAGLGADRATELVSAVNEVATNSVMHGGGGGIIRIWRRAGDLICEIRDGGSFTHPLADRTKPGTPRDPQGLWLANQLCDLVQIRSFQDGTAVRLHMRLDP
ncbi:MAG TPA: sensor histidine kinase [Candidatus Limnocylindrales bacterium]|nr:sensor histidine kinase [Candidatus Limnocylindrales bacterium]